jgi:hypothetical protein
MSKKTTRWPIWKIITATVACAVASPLLFWLSVVIEELRDAPETGPGTPSPMMTPSGFIMMLGVASAMLAVLGIIWAVARIQDARTPTWKKKGKKKRL